ncbi:ribonuclease H-like domain-containing protein [Tanacetum coccineum]
MHDPRDPHFTALKRILRYVRGTLDYGMQLHVSSTTQLTEYSPVTRAVTLSRSSAEAKYRGVANVVAETAWIRNLLCELHTPLFTATLVYCDNALSAVYNVCKSVPTSTHETQLRSSHFVRDFVASGQVRVLHVPSRFQYADIFTKGLPTALFIEFRSSLNVRRSPAHTEGEMAKTSEYDGESDTRSRFDQGMLELTRYGDEGRESPILKTGYGGGDGWRHPREGHGMVMETNISIADVGFAGVGFAGADFAGTSCRVGKSVLLVDYKLGLGIYNKLSIWHVGLLILLAHWLAAGASAFSCCWHAGLLILLADRLADAAAGTSAS